MGKEPGSVQPPPQTFRVTSVKREGPREEEEERNAFPSSLARPLFFFSAERRLGMRQGSVTSTCSLARFNCAYDTTSLRKF